jgi:ABC-type antimicrobial peptide transport system permease subunit
VSLEATVPIENVETSDLFEGKTISLRNISTLDNSAALLYTTKEFSYFEDEPIPIILSANSFTYTYEDWSEGDSVTIEMGNPQDMNQEPREGGQRNRVTVAKTEAIEYSKEDLIGKTFTIKFGGLDDITTYTTEMDRENREMTITKLTDEEYEGQLEERKEVISEYWNYDEISTPIKYTFVVAGVDEKEGSNVNYIPESFADTLMQEYISNEINARVVDEIPTDVLNADFLGLTYNGDELSSTFGGMMSQIGGRFEQRGGGFGQPSESEEDQEVSFSAITIPGLVIDIDANNNTVNGTLDDPEIYSEATKYASKINIVLSSITYRSEVIKSLNKAGYAYQDLGDLDVFENLESTLETVSTTFLISFIVLIALIVILTMGKLVSESIREIGIFRAIGIRKKDILIMFVTQAFLYTAVGYIIGLLLGVLLNYATSTIVASWFDSFIEETVSQSFNVVNTVENTLFINIDWSSILTYSALLFIISFIVSIIPSMNASKISPVEAIKNE